MEESTVTKQWSGYLTKIHIYQEQRPFESVTIYVLCILYSDHPISFHHCIFSHICTNISLFQEKAGRLNIEGVIWQKNHYYQKQRPIRSATNPKIDSIKKILDGYFWNKANFFMWSSSFWIYRDICWNRKCLLCCLWVGVCIIYLWCLPSLQRSLPPYSPRRPRALTDTGL